MVQWSLHCGGLAHTHSSPIGWVLGGYSTSSSSLAIPTLASLQPLNLHPGWVKFCHYRAAWGPGIDRRDENQVHTGATWHLSLSMAIKTVATSKGHMTRILHHFQVQTLTMYQHGGCSLLRVPIIGVSKATKTQGRKPAHF